MLSTIEKIEREIRECEKKRNLMRNSKDADNATYMLLVGQILAYNNTLKIMKEQK